MTKAIVLSGGGSKGDFEVGALRYLYDQGIRPDILCGTSVGSINAAKLAEGEDPANPQQGLPGLEAIWSDMFNTSDMITREPWLNDPNMDPRIVQILLGWRAMSDSGLVPQPSYFLFDPFGLISGIAYIAEGASDMIAIVKSLQVVLQSARGMFNLGPISERLATSLDAAKVAAWAASGKQLRLAMVSLESGKLRYAGPPAAGGGECPILERDGTPLTEVPASACAAQKQRVKQAIQQLARLQQQLSGASIHTPTTGNNIDGSHNVVAPSNPADLGALIQQMDTAMHELDAARNALDACQSQQQGVPVSAPLATCVMASAGIPVFFLPVAVGSGNYVDGGVREVLPLQAAMDLGADEIYAISVSMPVSKADSFTSSGILDIGARVTLDIMTDEIGRGDFRARAPGATQPKVTVIQPEFEVHNFLAIDPGLIRIARDYGYMMAADTLTGNVSQEESFSATAIAKLRVSTWEDENQYEGKVDAVYPVAPIGLSGDPQQLNDVKRGKSQLYEALASRKSHGLAVPDGIEQFAGQDTNWQYELHAWKYDDATLEVTEESGDSDHSTTWKVVVTNKGQATWWPDDTLLVITNGGHSAVPNAVRPGESHTFTVSRSSTLPKPAFMMARQYATNGPMNLFGKPVIQKTKQLVTTHRKPPIPRTR